jgi:alpha-beta hydrolase superfamily lysophospholipase
MAAFAGMRGFRGPRRTLKSPWFDPTAALDAKGRVLAEFRSLCVLFCALALASCVSFPPAPPARTAPRLDGDRLIAADGAALAVEVWRAESPMASLIAVHGMNDYGRHFADMGAWLSARGVTVYAYDMRGFGRSPEFGRWVGEETLRADLVSAIAAVRAEAPERPLFVLGHSTGGAVVLSAAREAPLDVDGAIFAAPAVWGGSRMPIFYRLSANVAAAVMPGKTLTGERAGRQSTDNIEALREIIADPYVIKATRLDAVLGVTRIMGSAWNATDETGGRILYLTGEKDEIIPPKAQDAAFRRLCGSVDRRLYPDGWHLLARDLQREAVFRDIVGWLAAAAREKMGAAGAGIGPAALACVGARKSAFGAETRPADVREAAAVEGD